MEEGYKIYYKIDGIKKDLELNAKHTSHARNKFVNQMGGYKKMKKNNITISDIVTC